MDGLAEYADVQPAGPARHGSLEVRSGGGLLVLGDSEDCVCGDLVRPRDHRR